MRKHLDAASAESAVLVGNGEAWKLLSGVLNGDRQDRRLGVLRSLHRWPDDKPVDMLMKIAKSSESAIRICVSISSQSLG